MDEILNKIKELIFSLPESILEKFDLFAILQKFLGSLLADILSDWLGSLQSIVGNIVNTAFYIERIPGLNSGLLNAGAVENAIRSLWYTCLCLLVLKLLWKGYKVYILWRGGDSEVSPLSMLLAAVFALGTAMAFPLLYDVAVGIVKTLDKIIMDAFHMDPNVNLFAVLGSLFSPWMAVQNATFLIILALAFIILCAVLVFQMVGRGAELLIFRLGVPFAVVGLVDSDDGIWKSYIQLLFRQFATILAQDLCLHLAIGLAAAREPAPVFVGIIFLITAFKTPKLLSSLLVTGGGGGANKLYTVTMVAKTFLGGV